MTIKRHVKLEFRFGMAKIYENFIYENKDLILLNHAYGLK